MPGSANRECLYIRANTPSELCAWVRSCSRPTCLLCFDARSLLCLSLSLFPSVPAVLAATQYRRDTRREKNCRKAGEAKREAVPAACRNLATATVGRWRSTREPREIRVRVQNSERGGPSGYESGGKKARDAIESTTSRAASSLQQEDGGIEEGKRDGEE